MAAVEQLAYRPNLVARNLRSQQSNTIGLIVSDIRNPFFTAISRAVEDSAYENGYAVLLCNTDEDPEKEAIYLRLMQDENVAGIIISPTRRTIARFADFNIDLPTVAIDRSLKRGDFDAVLLDNVAAAYDLTTHLIEQGYRRIGTIIGDVATTGRERQQGYEDALREHGLASEPELVKYVQPRGETGRTAALELIALPRPPDAILTSNSLLTEGALQALRERQLAIPDDVALAGFDDTTWASLVQPAITVMAQPTDEIGRTATELLLQRLVEPGRSARKVILRGQLRMRGSSLCRQ
jgi:LacI family fructose operon transcriptional repressor